MAKFERIAKIWVPLTNAEEYAWPLDKEHFGEDVDEYAKRLRDFVIQVNEDGTGVWSMGLHKGTLRVAPGSETGHFDVWKGELFVCDEDNSVGTEGWTAQLRMFLVSGERGEVCKVIWNWRFGPCKEKAVTTYWRVSCPETKNSCCVTM